MIYLKKLIVFLLFIGFSILHASKHPNLILTKKGVNAIQKHLGTIPIFDQTLARVKQEVDKDIATGIHVPIPKDMAGGYTHDRHKKNWFTLQKAGVLYQILDEEKYAIYVKQVLMSYAKMYKNLPLHPKERSYARGKIFWQCLNDANWLVYVSQAYDCIYDYLSKSERVYLEEELFIPYAEFLSEQNPKFFNRIHNHSTWGNVAVGMIGLVMNNEKFIRYALEGLDATTFDKNAMDNDGGLIYDKDRKAGFLSNLDQPFSPDGYYTEGPYYQRYAMYPFMVFAEALENTRPDLKIFNYKEGVLIKGVDALLQLTNEKGEFFPLNDGQKGMSYLANELVAAVDIAYHFGKQDATLLSIAKKQNTVLLDNTGLSVALALQQNKQQVFKKKSIQFRDGSKGDEGAVSILRAQKKPFTVVMKNTAQGLSHGHYDKLSFSYYHKGEEVLQDYGLSRFVNVKQKNGGGYLKENKTFAKQSIAHNTVVLDETSHFKGKYKIGSQHHSEVFAFKTQDPNLQLASAIELNAYPDTKLHRSLILLEDQDFEQPLLIDVFNIDSKNTHKIDLPFYYHDQIIGTNFKYQTPKVLTPLGEKNGYQHLWLEGQTPSLEMDKTLQVTWRSNNQFYTISSALSKGDELLFTRIGANDPKFNLRRDPAFILRKKDVKNEVFINILETHGGYNAVTESATNAFSSIKNIELIKEVSEGYIAFKIITTKDKVHLFALCLERNATNKKHYIEVEGITHHWKGEIFHYVN